MECKCNGMIFLFLKKQELIDTLWNVNETITTRGVTVEQELIDTLWNVNSGAAGPVGLG